MKRLVVALIAVLSIGLSSVTSPKVAAATESATIKGAVTQAGQKVDGANIKIECWIGDVSHYRNTTANTSGTYSFTQFPGELCPEGSRVVVTAQKDSASGSAQSVMSRVDGKLVVAVDVQLVTVSVPEFRFVPASIAIATVATSIAVIRRRLVKGSDRPIIQNG